VLLDAATILNASLSEVKSDPYWLALVNDFGLLDSFSDRVVTPLYLQTFLATLPGFTAAFLICSTITDPKIIDQLTQQAVIPIARGTGTLGYQINRVERRSFYAMGAIYTVALLVIIGVQIFSSIYNKFKAAIMNTIFRSAISLAFFFRLTYFFIVASSNIFQEHQATNFAIMMLPTSFYFTTVSAIIVLWVLLNFVENMATFRLRFYSTFIGVNIFSYLVLIAFIITIGSLQLKANYACFGRFIELSAARQRAFSVSYTSLVLFVAVLSTGILLVMGTLLFKKLKASGSLKLMIPSIISACSFVCHCTLIFYMSTVSKTVDFWIAFIFIPVEILPNIGIAILALSGEVSDKIEENHKKSSTSKEFGSAGSGGHIDNDDWS